MKKGYIIIRLPDDRATTFPTPWKESFTVIGMGSGWNTIFTTEFRKATKFNSIKEANEKLKKLSGTTDESANGVYLIVPYTQITNYK